MLQLKACSSVFCTGNVSLKVLPGVRDDRKKITAMSLCSLADVFVLKHDIKNKRGSSFFSWVSGLSRFYSIRFNEIKVIYYN